MFLSANYARKAWTSHERRNAQAGAFRENREYILPLRLDDTSIPGIPETVGYVDLRHTTIEKVVEMLETKLGKRLEISEPIMPTPEGKSVTPINLIGKFIEISDRGIQVSRTGGYHYSSYFYFSQAVMALGQPGRGE
jgi:TIR domain